MPYPPIWNTIKTEFTNIGQPITSQEWQNLTFTYIFDHFCHSLVGHDQYAVMRNAGGYPKLQNGNQKRLQYFTDFFKKYIPPEPDQDRIDQFDFASRISSAADILTQSDYDIRSFFLRLHAVKSSENRPNAERVIRTINIDELKNLLTLIRNESLDYDRRFAEALDKAGVGISYIGQSCVGEIFGWLMPNKYPIVNDKFYDTLFHLGL